MIPDMPDFLSGVINLRGTVIPVIDVQKRFHITSRPERERIIIVWVSRQMVGLTVDSVREITGFTDDEIIAPPPLFKGFKPEYLVGLGKKEDRVVILLNTDSILTAEEKIELIESGKKMEMSLDHESAKTPEER